MKKQTIIPTYNTTNRITQSLKMLVLVFGLSLLSVGVFAQDPGTPDGSTDPDAAVPIDGGISLLVAAGVGYGAKKINDRRNRKW
jgi:hypothetical protein